MDMILPTTLITTTFFDYDNSLKNDTTREIVEDETEIVTKQQFAYNFVTL